MGVRLAACADFPTLFGAFRLCGFKDDGGGEHLALLKGEVKGKENVLVRIHSSCLTGDALGSLKCDCRQQLHESLKRIAGEECGVLAYLAQEGRGIGLLNKVKAYALQDEGRDTVQANEELGFKADEREYAVAAEMLDALGVRSVRLLSNNPEKVSSLEAAGMRVTERVPIVVCPNEYNRQYLQVKQEKLGHVLNCPDEVFMSRAIELAARGKGRVSPNPLVGCVIVKDGVVVGEGFHEFFGGPHAEVNALKQAGGKAKGATMYVSLEPCSHYGKTPPCVNAITESGVAKVVIALLDPNPVVFGKGVEALKRAGIEVVVGVNEDEAKKLNEAFFKFITTKRPFVLLKAAVSLDGKISSPSVKQLSNDESMKRVHELRNEYDAILVGVNTVLADDPLLSCRLEGGRDPLRVILDRSLRVPLQAKVLCDSNALVATTKKADEGKKKELESRGVKVLVLPEDAAGRVDLNALLDELGRQGIASLLVEGGSQVITSFLEQGLADKALFFVAPKLLGEGVPLTRLAGGIELRDVAVSVLGDHALFEGTPVC